MAVEYVEQEWYACEVCICSTDERNPMGKNPQKYVMNAPLQVQETGY